MHLSQSLRLISCSISIACALLTSAQRSPAEILKEVLDISQESSMYSNEINWDSLRMEVRQQGKDARTVADLKPAFEALLNGIRDHHGKIIDAKTYQPIAHFTDYKHIRHHDHREFPMETWKIINDTSLQFQHALLENNVAYLRIVGIGPMVDIEKEAIKIRSAVEYYSKKKIKHWIIDLRYNGGGNMYPMMAGLGPLIGDGLVGSLVTSYGESLFDWSIRKGNFFYGEYEAVHLKNKFRLRKRPAVAVLTSRWTASSGELVATAFKGRPNTRFFGEMTGGYASNTGWEIIGDSVIVNISTGLFCDRNGIAYPINLPVDSEIPFEIVSDIRSDNCIKAALAWFKAE